VVNKKSEEDVILLCCRQLDIGYVPSNQDTTQSVYRPECNDAYVEQPDSKKYAVKMPSRENAESWRMKKQRL